MSYLLVILAMLLCLGSCGDRGRVIPRAKMARIYADMFIADQWMRDHPEYRKEADTTLFFEAVFQKYGYTKKDYEASVAEYVKDPVKYSKILEMAVDLMKARRDAVRDLPDSVTQSVPRGELDKLDKPDKHNRIKERDDETE